MPVDSQKSCEAYSQIGQSDSAAASNLPQPDSLNMDCDPRGFHPVAGRGAATGQPFPIGGVAGVPLRPRRHIPDDLLTRIREAEGQPFALLDPAPPWWVVGLWCAATAAFVLFVFWLNDAASAGRLL